MTTPEQLQDEMDVSPRRKPFYRCCCCYGDNQKSSGTAEKHREKEAPVQMENSGVSVDVKADRGANVFAPVVKDNTFNRVVNNYRSKAAGNDQKKSTETAKKHRKKAPVQGSSAQTGVSVNVNAGTDASVNIPLLSGSTFDGPVYFNGSNAARNVPVPPPRNDFLQYSKQFTLDLNTVNNHLRLSENNREITFINPVAFQPYPDHPDRFDVYNAQVLCNESVCGRCYWEIEWSGVFGGVCISVSYKSISRKGGGNECVFGSNDKSWGLSCSSSSYSFKHNNMKTDLPVKPISHRIGVHADYSRIGVYVDYKAGTLSFYSVYRDTVSLIHTVQTTFTQKLYPGFRFSFGSSLKLC